MNQAFQHNRHIKRRIPFDCSQPGGSGSTDREFVQLETQSRVRQFTQIRVKDGNIKVQVNAGGREDNIGFLYVLSVFTRPLKEFLTFMCSYI